LPKIKNPKFLYFILIEAWCFPNLDVEVINSKIILWIIHEQFKENSSKEFEILRSL
jgi:hypothetical protein